MQTLYYEFFSAHKKEFAMLLNEHLKAQQKNLLTFN